MAAQGFNSEQVGEVVAWTGLPQLLVIPLLPLLMKRIDARLLVATGLLIFAGSCFMNLQLDQDYAAPQLFWPNVVRALGQAIVLTPLSAIAMLGITPQEAGAASGLFNMMRNLGGAIGTAAIETFFTKREQFHSFIINQGVSLVEPATRNRLAELQQYFMSHGFPDPAGALHRAVIAVGQTIRAQATIMGYAGQLRPARGRAVGRRAFGCDAQKGHRLRRRRTLSEAACPARADLFLGQRPAPPLLAPKRRWIVSHHQAVKVFMEFVNPIPIADLASRSYPASQIVYADHRSTTECQVQLVPDPRKALRPTNSVGTCKAR